MRWTLLLLYWLSPAYAGSHFAQFGALECAAFIHQASLEGDWYTSDELPKLLSQQPKLSDRAISHVKQKIGGADTWMQFHLRVVEGKEEGWKFVDAAEGTAKLYIRWYATGGGDPKKAIPILRQNEKGRRLRGLLYDGFASASAAFVALVGSDFPSIARVVLGGFALAEGAMALRHAWGLAMVCMDTDAACLSRFERRQMQMGPPYSPFRDLQSILAMGDRRNDNEQLAMFERLGVIPMEDENSTPATRWLEENNGAVLGTVIFFDVSPESGKVQLIVLSSRVPSRLFSDY